MRIAKHCCQGNETCYAVTVKDADLAQSLETKRTLSNTQKPFLLWDSSLTTFLFLAFFSWCHKHALLLFTTSHFVSVSGIHCVGTFSSCRCRVIVTLSLQHWDQAQMFQTENSSWHTPFLSLLPVLIKRSLTSESPCTAGGQSVLRLPGHVSAYPCSVRRSVMFPSDL